MFQDIDQWLILRKLVWQDMLLVLGALLAAHLLVMVVRWMLRRVAEKGATRLRLPILRMVPIVRLVIYGAAGVAVAMVLIEPTFRNAVTLIVGVGLALAFAFKEYASNVVAGLAVILENTYQPGDWIEIDGVYGEVKSIDARAVHLVTADDTEVVVPHSRLWSASIHNASSGNRSLLCVTDFYLHPDHDAAAVRGFLVQIAESSVYRKANTPVAVIVLEKPWGTHYRVKNYVSESREQFLLMTDVTVRGKEVVRKLGIRFAQATLAVGT